MACFKTCSHGYYLHPATTRYAISIVSTRHNTPSPSIKRNKRRKFRYIKEFEEIDAPKKGELVLNEHGEYHTKYGDWLHNANETVYVRDRRIWEEEFRKLRKKYKQEYSEKFRQRLAEFTRIADAKMYNISLQDAQKKERRRLSNVRINALRAANRATKARNRLDLRRRDDIIRYDAKDSKRDVIREMMWEKPDKNWIIKENFNEKLTQQFMDDVMDHVDDDYVDNMYSGLPSDGYYDTMEGLMRHSDRYFSDIDNNPKDEQSVTTITKQPISWYVRQNDTRDEYVEEIYQSQQKINKHLRRNTHNARNRANAMKKQSVNEDREQNIEYEVDSDNIVPNYWLNIDWDKEFEQRTTASTNNLDKSAIFVGNKLMLAEVDKYEDYKLMLNKEYHKLLANVEHMTKREIIQCLKQIFVDLIPDEMVNQNKYNEIESKPAFVEMIIDEICSELNTERATKEMDDKRWALYREFHDKMKHFASIHWKSAKINFDSEIRSWRNDFLKWRYLVFNDNKEHIEWRQRLRNTDLSANDISLCQKAVVRLEQLEHLILARRTGPQVLEKLVNELEPEVLKVFYIWFEELTENGEEICMGRGWSFNRYEEQKMLPHIKSKQIPIEYFKLNKAPRSVGMDHAGNEEQHFMYKSY
eukprot:194899_1